MSPLILAIFMSLLVITPASQVLETEGPSESECRPYIEKALQGALHNDDSSSLGEENESVSSDEQKNFPIETERTSTDEEENIVEDVINNNEAQNEPMTGTNVEVSELDHEQKPESQTDPGSRELPQQVSEEQNENSTEYKEVSKEEAANEIEDSTKTDYISSENTELFDEIKSNDLNEKELKTEVDTDKESTEINFSSQELEEQDEESNTESIKQAIESQETNSNEETEIYIENKLEQMQSYKIINEKSEKGQVDLQEEQSSSEYKQPEENLDDENEVLEEQETDILKNNLSQEDNTTNDEDHLKDEEKVISREEDEKLESQSEEENNNVKESQEHMSISESLKENEVHAEIEEIISQEIQSNEHKEESEKRSVEKTEDNSTLPEKGNLLENVDLNKKINDKTEFDPEINTDQKETNTDEDSKSMNEEKPNEVDVESKNGEEGAKADSGTNESTRQKGEDQKEEVAQLSELPEEEELTMVPELPEKLRSREHMHAILHLDSKTEDIEKVFSKTIDTTLKELKKLYDAAIKPLEILYKYRDLSNRHFGDPEIFSKPLILFMGPWSGGKSTIVNYLLENEYKQTALRTGADPSPAYFNIVMWGEEPEVVDGTQLAADWTFSGLQKFGQGLLDRLRGLKLNHPLLEKVNIVEIPGILEIRKQVERLFPFNDACQWFIDRADIIFLVYDPSKLDIGPETEAILDQLKGREMQTRIILNKADQVKPEELMRVQGTLIWNISPLMSSTEPPVMYSTSLWSLPYETGSPTRLLFAQEKAFLTDLRSAIDKRVESKIAGARRFAVRVRNHAKMVDCYLTTYYNHKSFFDNKKHVSDDIIEHPQNYHIYEGLSTLTNISRYDLPDPETYRDFFRLNPVYEFQQLSATCTYFRGCPINRLDLAIAYDLPELIGKYKQSIEEVLKSYKAGN